MFISTLPKMHRANKSFLLGAALLVGCAHEAALRPEDLKITPAFSQAGVRADADWWKSFNEPQLNGLIDRAMLANPDLAVARARWREARAALQAADAALLPRVDAQVSYNSQRTSAESGRNFPGMPRRFDTATVGAQASWELDLWGRNSARSAAAAADALAAGFTAESVRVALGAEVARLWFAVQSARRDVSCLTDEFQARYREMEIIEQGVKAGLLSTDPLSTAQLAAAQAKLDEGQAHRRLAGFENALCVVIGAQPGEMLPSSPSVENHRINPTFGAGVPSELLLHRPDLASSAARLDAAMSREGAARADFYPSVTLTGQAGWQADPASRLGRGSAGFWTLMPSVDLPLFDGQSREANLEAQRARIDLAGAEWRKAVLVAFREVEDALADLRELNLQVDLALRVQKAAADRLKNAQTRLQAGVADEREQVIARRDAAQALRTYSDLELERCQVWVRLAAATGGGWVRPAAEPAQ